MAAITVCGSRVTESVRGTEGISSYGAAQFSYRDRYGSPFRDPLRSREWLSLGLGCLERENVAGDPVHDSIAFAIGGGFDLVTGRWRPSIEIGGAFASHRVDTDSGTRDRIGLGRGLLGGRLTHFGDRLRPYVRAGGFRRFVYDEADEMTLDLDEHDRR